MNFEKTKFSVVTVFPSVENNFGTFMLPFDTTTWILIVISSVMISILVRISVSDSGFGYRFTLKEHISHDLYDVGALLLGHGGSDDFSKIFANRRVAVVISTVWFFGCYILMANLYKGSIFSFLTVPVLPNVPETIEQLLSSNIPILTTTSSGSYLVSLNRSTPTIKDDSTLRSIIIPQLKAVMAANSSYSKSIASLDQRLTYVNHFENSIKEIVLNISSSKPIQNKFKTSTTFALMNDANDLKHFTEPIKFLGKRFVIDSSDDTGFQTITVMYGTRNFIFPRFYLVYRRLVESGLVEIWS